MRRDSSNHQADAKALVLMIAITAGAVGLVGLVLDHLSIDTSQVHPIASARASSHAPAPRKTPEVVTKDEETWAADESSHGMRPEAAH
jgi:hypothetical protein